MFNLKLSVIVSGLAFLLSLLVGLLSRSALPALVLRPLVFAVLFFALTMFITLLINRFLPELLESRDNGPDLILPGARIDIKEDDTTVPADLYARPDDSDENLGNIAEISTGTLRPSSQGLNTPGLDQDEQNEYTETEHRSVPAGENGIDVLPDLESLAGAFLSPPGETDESIEYQTPEITRKPVIGNRAQKMDGDFDPKDLAAGIRTILKKQEG